MQAGQPVVTTNLTDLSPFLYALKTSENLTVFWYFQGVGNECIGNKWVKLEIPEFNQNGFNVNIGKKHLKFQR